MNARSARDKFLRFPLVSVYRSFASCSTMQTSRSSERRESGGVSMEPRLASGVWATNQGHQAEKMKTRWALEKKGVNLILFTSI